MEIKHKWKYIQIQKRKQLGMQHVKEKQQTNEKTTEK